MASLFSVSLRPTKEQDTKVAKKSKSVNRSNSTMVKVGTSLLEQISLIKSMVEKNLGYLKDDYIVITDIEELDNYFSECIKNNVISVDTETTGLDPMQDKIVGLCIYTPNMPPAYVPINHVSYVTGVRIDKQLMENQVAKALQNMIDNKSEDFEVVMFNANFDMRVIKNQLDVELDCTFDCYLASRLLNENEPAKGLKPLHKKYVLKGEGDAFSFDTLFKGIPFDKIPISTGYLYAAHDAIITYELYEYQKPFLTPDNEKCIEHELQDVSWVFYNIEMPCVKVVAEMEDNGITFDMNYQRELSVKYNKLQNEKLEEFHKLCDEYSNDIEAYKAKNINAKIENPINISSPTQLAILLYDILKVEPPDPKSPRGTGADILAKIDLPICKAILEYRGVEKLVSTYIDKLPNCVNPKDGRIHCHFNQYGADTGRMSSSDPKQIISNWGRKIQLIQGRACA